MNRFNLVVLLAFASGCNSGEFSTFTPSASDAPDAAPGGSTSTGGTPGTGGRVATTTGGSPATGGAGGGGLPSSTGGSPATGGLLETGGAPVVDACALVTHDNGLGQTWQDCVPLGTYDEAQAMKACKASDAVICIKSERCGPGVYEVQGFNTDRSVWIGEWGYGSFATGLVSIDGLCSGSSQIWT